MRKNIADLKMLLVINIRKKDTLLQHVKIQNLWRPQRVISLIQSFLLTLQRNIKKKNVKKLTEKSDSEVDFSLNKIVIQRSSLEHFVIPGEINNR